MSDSSLQEPFVRDVAANFAATKNRILRRIAEAPSKASPIVEEELRGHYHGVFVIFDGGPVLADEGLISIVDEFGNEFDRSLHETCFSYWPESHG